RPLALLVGPQWRGSAVARSARRLAIQPTHLHRHRGHPGSRRTRPRRRSPAATESSDRTLFGEAGIASAVRALARAARPRMLAGCSERRYVARMSSKLVTRRLAVLLFVGVAGCG